MKPNMKIKVLLSCILALSCLMSSCTSKDGVYAVEDEPGYNCWPMIQSIDDRLVCIYTIGKEHNPSEKGRAAYARFSDDGAKTWSERVLIDQDDSYGTSSIGKGLDEDGNALFWIRRMGADPRMALFRTKDGKELELISTPHLDPNPMQITDVFHTPDGLKCLWFSDDYNHDLTNKSWGVLVSKDNGVNWEQIIIEKDLALSEWPTEQSVVAFGDGRLLAIARSEAGSGNQFQLTSTDWGKSWAKQRTNISDVRESTPSLILDSKSGTVYNYYYQRGPGLLKLREVDAEYIFSNPESWPEPQVIAEGGKERPFDSGNANAVQMGKAHYITYYSGDPVNCKVLVAVRNRP